MFCQLHGSYLLPRGRTPSFSGGGGEEEGMCVNCEDIEKPNFLFTNLSTYLFANLPLAIFGGRWAGMWNNHLHPLPPVENNTRNVNHINSVIASITCILHITWKNSLTAQETHLADSGQHCFGALSTGHGTSVGNVLISTLQCRFYLHDVLTWGLTLKRWYLEIYKHPNIGVEDIRTFYGRHRPTFVRAEKNLKSTNHMFSRSMLLQILQFHHVDFFLIHLMNHDFENFLRNTPYSTG